LAYREYTVDDEGWTEWVQPIRRGYKMRCCDCGLVHEMMFRSRKGRVQFRARRHERATAGSRIAARSKQAG
jgi:hypothetical protein